MVTTAGAIEFDIGISQSSINDALRAIQNGFDRSGASINNLAITPQGLANIKEQIERTLRSVDTTIPAPIVPAPRVTPPRGPTAPTTTPPSTPRQANTDVLTSLRSQLIAAQAITAETDEQAAKLRRQAALISEAVRFKKQLAAIRNAGLSDRDLKQAEDFARQLTRINRQKINIPVEIDADEAVSQARRTNDLLTGIFQGIGQQITQILVDAIRSGVGAITDLGRSSLSAAQDLRSINASLTTSLGSTQAAAEAYEFAASTLDRLGASVETGTRQYAALTAAAQAAGVQQSLSNEFFESFTETLVSNGVAVEAQNRAFNAASQIFAKNRLSAEELRQQLAEALPSAIGIVASGLGEIGLSANGTTEELNELLESGSISAEQFAQAWIAGSGQFQSAIDPINQSVAQAGNRLLEFRQQAGAALAPLQVAVLDGFSRALDAISTSQAFEIIEQGINDFNRSLANSGDIATDIRRTIELFGEGTAQIFADLVRETGRFIESLSPQDIQAFNSNFERGVNALSASISVISRVATGLAKAAAVLDNFTSLLLNSPDWAGFFLPGLRIVGTLLAPLKAAEIAIANIEGAINGLSAVESPDLASRIAGDAIDGANTLTNVLRNVSEGIQQLDQESAQSAQESAAQREEANKAALEAFQRDTENAILAIDQAQADSINRIRQRQLEGQITSEQADQEIAQVKANADARIAAKEDEIRRINQLELQGALTAEEAADRKAQAELEKSNLVLDSLEAEIKAQEEAQKAAIARIDAELDAAQQLSDIRQKELDLASQALTQQNNLISSQLDLQESQSNLEQARLKNVLEIAKAEGDIDGVRRAALGLSRSQQQQVAREFELKEKQTQITIQQNKLEAQRNILVAEIAATEAQLAVNKARTEDRSTAEIANLQTLVTLAQREVGVARDNAAVIDDINSALLSQLSTEEDIALERLKQVDAITEIAKAEEDLAKRQQDLANVQVDSAQKVADARRQALSGLFSAISQEASRSTEEGLEAIEAAQDRLRIAQGAGFFRDEEGRGAAQATSQALRRVEGLIARNASDQELARAAFRATQDGDEGQAFLEALQIAGRGDIAALAGAEDEFTNIANVIDEGNRAIVDKLEEIRLATLNLNITQAENIGSSLSDSELQQANALASQSLTESTAAPTSIQNLNITTPDPVADTAKILFDFNAQQTRGLR